MKTDAAMATVQHSIGSGQQRITIGMPVRNGSKHIGDAIRSFLHQSFRDFRIIVYDNASTDGTRDAVRKLMADDPRISLVAHESNIGGAMNFIVAAEQADTPLFCWAAHDDLRAPAFLQSLVALLDAHPNAQLASCAVRNMDPDGTLQCTREETASLCTSHGMSPAQRIRMYLREMPGTPFYGVFRTASLQAALHTLHELNREAGTGPAMLGIDMIFLARFIRDFDIAVTNEPLLMFRRGGVSHNLGRYGSFRKYMHQVRCFCRSMRQATLTEQSTFSERLGTAIVRSVSMCKWLCTRDMRCMTSHYLREATPWLERPRTWLALWASSDFRRLRKRLANAANPSSTIVVFGAGKHTRRRWAMLQRVARPNHTIIACCDERSDLCDSLDGVPVVLPSALRELKPDVLLVSSDMYERAMYRRAKEIAPRGTLVWAIYDPTLETTQPDSTSAQNSSIAFEPTGDPLRA